MEICMNSASSYLSIYFHRNGSFDVLKNSCCWKLDCLLGVYHFRKVEFRNFFSDSLGIVFILMNSSKLFSFSHRFKLISSLGKVETSLTKLCHNKLVGIPSRNIVCLPLKEMLWLTFCLWLCWWKFMTFAFNPKTMFIVEQDEVKKIIQQLNDRCFKRRHKSSRNIKLIFI